MGNYFAIKTLNEIIIIKKSISIHFTFKNALCWLEIIFFLS